MFMYTVYVDIVWYIIHIYICIHTHIYIYTYIYMCISCTSTSFKSENLEVERDSWDEQRLRALCARHGWVWGPELSLPTLDKVHEDYRCLSAWGSCVVLTKHANCKPKRPSFRVVSGGSVACWARC